MTGIRGYGVAEFHAPWSYLLLNPPLGLDLKEVFLVSSNSVWSIIWWHVQWQALPFARSCSNYEDDSVLTEYAKSRCKARFFLLPLFSTLLLVDQTSQSQSFRNFTRWCHPTFRKQGNQLFFPSLTCVFNMAYTIWSLNLLLVLRWRSGEVFVICSKRSYLTTCHTSSPTTWPQVGRTTGCFALELWWTLFSLPQTAANPWRVWGSIE